MSTSKLFGQNYFHVIISLTNKISLCTYMSRICIRKVMKKLKQAKSKTDVLQNQINMIMCLTYS